MNQRIRRFRARAKLSCLLLPKFISRVLQGDSGPCASLPARRAARAAMSIALKVIPSLVLALISLETCISGASATSTPAPRTETPLHERRIVEIHRGFGTACQVDSRTGPFSYLTDDSGKKGVPRITSADRALIRRIEQFLHSRTLRFTYLGTSLLVFNATSGPCEPDAPGYPVLNSASCNLFYSPTDDFDGPRAFTRCDTSRPWFSL